MKFYRIAAFCLISLFLPVHLAQADSPADSVQTSPQGVQNAERLVKPADTTHSTAEFAEWEKRYIKETRITIENNVKSLMDGLRSSQRPSTVLGKTGLLRVFSFWRTIVISTCMEICTLFR